jgi:sigma-E factor negative regulatory protein RseC
MNDKDIEHIGVVENIEGEHMLIRIEQTSACASCTAHSLCNASDKKEMTVDVYSKQSGLYHKGQEVLVVGSVSMGMKAVWLAYCVPLLLLVTVLMVVVSTTKNEPLSAIVSILSLLPYYLVLYALRKKLRSKFSFTLKNI